jgi:hypothetical protein
MKNVSKFFLFLIFFQIYLKIHQNSHCQDSFSPAFKFEHKRGSGAQAVWPVLVSTICGYILGMELNISTCYRFERDRLTMIILTMLKRNKIKFRARKQNLIMC